jgi:deoxyadenosine/deoxycytidine kinase
VTALVGRGVADVDTLVSTGVLTSPFKGRHLQIASTSGGGCVAGEKIYIAIAGNIGAGKSTLVEFLTSTYGVAPFFEPNDDNPYLADFYQDMDAWAFHSQVFFLAHKFRIHQELDRTAGIVVQDRTIYEDAEIFATALHASKRMTDRDWKTYEELYKTICSALRPPDLLIYLKCSLKTTKQRIKLRGRPMEQAIPPAYLRLLQDLYDRWLEKWTACEVLRLDTDRLDYISDLVDRLDVMDRIERLLPRASIEAARASGPSAA